MASTVAGVTSQMAAAAAAGLVALAFTATVFERWLDRRRPQDASWTAALLLFAVAAFALLAGASAGWSAVPFKVFYAIGAVANVPILALGTVYLMASRPVANRIAAVTVTLSAFAVGVVVASPITGEFVSGQLPQGSAVFGPGPRIAAAVASSVGALVIMVGSAVSAVRLFALGGAKDQGAWGNVSIVAGALVLSSGGVLNSVFDAMTGFAVTLVVGVVLIFAGALLATGVKRS